MIGLALAGGGVKGSYEAGAYKAMRKCHIKINAVTGTSIGSFNAAMIAAKKEKELYNFWNNVDVASILGIDHEAALSLSKKHKNIDNYKNNLKEVGRFIKNRGIDVEGLEEVLKHYNVEQSVANSSIDFGVCTFKINSKEPIEVFKKDIPKGKIEEFIIASCFLPIFKPKKIIDNSFYFDGGIYDNCPANMLLKKGYQKVYRVELNSIGRKQKLIDPSRVVTIEPSRKLSPIITFDKEEIINNYWIGYYDTLKVLKKYPGKHYLFVKRPLWYYKYLLRKVSKKKLKELMALYYALNEEELVIKVLERIMIKNNLSYFHIYNPRRIIKRYKVNSFI